MDANLVRAVAAWPTPTGRAEPDAATLRQIVAASSEGVILIDPDGAIRWANDAALMLHGVGSVAALGASAADYHDRFDLRHRGGGPVAIGDTPMERLLAGESFAGMVVVVTPAGADAPRRIHQVRGLAMPGDGAERLALIVQDVTLRFEAEDRFARTFDADPAPAIICRLTDHRVVKVNDGFLELTGFDSGHVLGRSVHDLGLFDGSPRRPAAVRLLEDGVVIPPLETELLTADGARRPIRIAGQPLGLDGLDCMLFTIADLDRSRRAEAALAVSEARFDRLFALAPVAIMVTVPDGRIERANPAFQRLTGHDAEMLVGRRAEELQLWESGGLRRAMEAELRGAADLPARDGRLRHRSGALIDCLVSAMTVDGPDGDSVLWVLQDVSDRRGSEQEMIASIEAAMREDGWFSRALVEKLANLRSPACSAEHQGEVAELTVREKEVLGYICQGADDAAIAARLTLSRNTVRNHVSRIYGKIGVRKRGAAIVWARERGLGHRAPVPAVS